MNHSRMSFSFLANSKCQITIPSHFDWITRQFRYWPFTHCIIAVVGAMFIRHALHSPHILRAAAARAAADRRAIINYSSSKSQAARWIVRGKYAVAISSYYNNNQPVSRCALACKSIFGEIMKLNRKFHFGKSIIRKCRTEPKSRVEYLLV